MKCIHSKAIILSIVILIFSVCSATSAEKIYYKSSDCFNFKEVFNKNNSPNTKVFGILDLPNSKTKVPAIIYVHGSGGPKKKNLQWTKQFNKMGIATFRIDSFNPRKVNSVNAGKHTSVTAAMMVADVYYALKLLSRNPKIDPRRIGVMGNSKGGGVAIFSSWEPLRKKLTPNLKLAFHIGLYPNCADFANMKMTGSPILILAGEKDKVTPVKWCSDFSSKLKGLKYDIEMIEYPGAYHSFDADYMVQSTKKAWDVSKCSWRIKRDGVAVELSSGNTDISEESKIKAIKSCGKAGAKMGRNSKAKKQAMKDTIEFISRIFKL